MNYQKALPLTIVASLAFWLNGCMSSMPRGKVGGHYVASDYQPSVKLGANTLADKIVVKQKEHKLYLYKKGKIIKTMPVSLGKNMAKGPKTKQGDFCTPAGNYRITGRRRHSVKYRAFDISYPNRADRARAAKLGVKPGSHITIHGQPHWNKKGQGDNYTLRYDWTNGCIAVTNKDLDWLWSSVRTGTPIIIKM